MTKFFIMFVVIINQMTQETLETIILGYITKELKNEIEIGRQVKLAKTIIQTLHINGFLDQNKKLVCNDCPFDFTSRCTDCKPKTK